MESVSKRTCRTSSPSLYDIASTRRGVGLSAEAAAADTRILDRSRAVRSHCVESSQSSYSDRVSVSSRVSRVRDLLECVEACAVFWRVAVPLLAGDRCCRPCAFPRTCPMRCVPFSDSGVPMDPLAMLMPRRVQKKSKRSIKFQEVDLPRRWRHRFRTAVAASGIHTMVF